MRVKRIGEYSLVIEKKRNERGEREMMREKGWLLVRIEIDSKVWKWVIVDLEKSWMRRENDGRLIEMEREEVRIEMDEVVFFEWSWLI